MLWDCSNDFDTEIKYKKGTKQASENQGVCAGLAIEFCKNILKGNPPWMSKPFLLQGMLYQRFYDWGKSSAECNSKLFSTASVTAGTRRWGRNLHEAATEVWNKDAVFWGGYDCHAIAVVKTAGTKSQLFFDPNYGCYEVHSKERLEHLFLQGKDTVNAGDWMEFYPMTLA
jgi:hypothetical protein